MERKGEFDDDNTMQTKIDTSLLEIIKMQKELISLLEKRVSILESVVFRDVRKKEGSDERSASN